MAPDADGRGGDAAVLKVVKRESRRSGSTAGGGERIGLLGRRCRCLALQMRELDPHADRRRALRRAGRLRDRGSTCAPRQFAGLSPNACDSTAMWPLLRGSVFRRPTKWATSFGFASSPTSSSTMLARSSPAIRGPEGQSPSGSCRHSHENDAMFISFCGTGSGPRATTFDRCRGRVTVSRHRPN